MIQSAVPARTAAAGTIRASRCRISDGEWTAFSGSMPLVRFVRRPDA
jgi:hypothetical protein